MICRRWKDYSSDDITLFKELPEWRQIVEDIETLISYQKIILQAFDDGEEIGREARMEEEYGLGFDAGLEEAERLQKLEQSKKT